MQGEGFKSYQTQLFWNKAGLLFIKIKVRASVELMRSSSKFNILYKAFTKVYSSPQNT
jgi:hypothetical protein